MKKKKKIETNSIMSRALFRVAQLKQKKIEITFLSSSLKWQNSLRTKFFPQFRFQNFYQKYRTIIFNLFVHRLFKNSQFRTCHCTHTNTVFSPEIGKEV